MSKNYIGKKKKGAGGLIVFCLLAFAFTFVISIIANSDFKSVGPKQNDISTELDELFASHDIQENVSQEDDIEVTYEEKKPVSGNYIPPEPQTEVFTQIESEPEEDIEVPVSAQPEKAVVPLVGGKIIKSFSTKVEYSPVYEDWRAHTAVDIGGEKGAEVNAVAGGVVVESYIDPAFGGVIKIDHGAFFSVYAGLMPETMEMNGTTVKSGDVIARLDGEILGEVSDTHLHFEIIENDIYTDPMKYIG